MLGFFGVAKTTQAFFWVLYFSSAQINNNISAIYCLCGITGYFLAAAVLALSVERVDCRAGGRGFDSWGRTNTQGLKITEK